MIVFFFFKNSTDQPAQILQQMSLLQLPTTEKNNTAYTVALYHKYCGSMHTCIKL